MMTVARIEESLEQLGVKSGATVYLRSRKSAIGPIEGRNPDTFLDILIDFLGPSGNLVCPAFTPYGRIGKPVAQPERYSDTNAGAISRQLTANPKALRSNHPTHSFVGLGPDVEQYFQNHEPHSECFLPIKKMIPENGLMLLLGCIDVSPGFSTVHVVQNELKLTQKHWLRFLLIAPDAKNSKGYVPEELPGCSRGFSKFYKNYLSEGVMVAGKVGEAATLALGMRDAYNIELDILKRDPKYALCDDPGCISCACLNGYNLFAMPKGLLIQASRQVRKISTRSDQGQHEHRP